MEIIGKEIECGLAIESSRGTAITTAQKWFRKVVANIVERAEHAVDDTVRGKIEDAEGRRVVQKYIEGELEGIVHADAIGYLLSNIYGVVVSTNVTGSIYSHVFNLGQNIQHPSLTVFAKDGSVQQLVYDNAMVNKLEISASLDDYVRFTASFLAAEATDNSDTPSYDTEYDFIARDITVKMADSEAGLSGATAMKVKDINISWDQGLIRDHVVGSYVPDDVYNSKLMIEGQFTLNFSEETYKDLYLGDSSKYMSITIQGETDLGSGNYPTITILLNKVQLMDWNRAGGRDDLVTEPISFRAFYNASDSKASQVTVKNLTASYANVPSS